MSHDLMAIIIIGGLASAMLYLACVILAEIAILLYHWCIDGDYEYKNPIVKRWMLMRGYKCTEHTSYSGNSRTFKYEKGKSTDDEGLRGVFQPAALLFAIPSISCTLINFWEVTAISVISISVLYLTRYVIRINTKLDSQIAKDAK